MSLGLQELPVQTSPPGSQSAGGLSFKQTMAGKEMKVLLLSVGYGEGHHAAARGAAEEFSRRGWVAHQVDICQASYPKLFGLTQKFYHFCVRRAPWLWGITYSLAEKADWRESVLRPPLSGCCDKLDQLVASFRPDAIVCTYPLFALMVDALRDAGRRMPPCFVVVTDSLEISRPWMTSKASLICLPDEHSALLVQQQYALSDGRVVVSGFPVSPAFRRGRGRPAPSPESLRLVYGAYAPLSRVLADVRGILARYPRAHLTLLAGERAQALRRSLTTEIERGSLDVLVRCEDMPGLFARSHLYIGKAGAATMYEAYSSELPCIVNYALPGQEQGNLRLLLLDGAGLYVESTEELLRCLSELLAHHAARWSQLASSMHRAARSHGAERLVDLIEQSLGHEGKDTSHSAGR